MLLTLKRTLWYLRSNWRTTFHSAILCCLAMYVLIAALSFNAADNSWFNFTDAENGINNLLGPIGAEVAAAIWAAFGYCFLLPVGLMLITALKLHLEPKESQLLIMRFSVMLLVFMPCAILLEFIPNDSQADLGGYLGVFLQSELSYYLQQNVIIALSLAFFVLSINFVINVKPKEILQVLKAMVKLIIIGAIYLFALLQLCYYYTKTLVAKLQKSEGAASQDDNADEQIRAKVINKISEVKAKVASNKKAKINAPALNAQPTFVFDNNNDFNLPSTSLLNALPAQSENKISSGMLEQSSKLLSSVLGDFGIKGEIQNVSQGPVVTLYEMEPAAGTKSSRVVGLSDDIARSMSAISARISVIPGKNAIGIELPNVKRKIVYLRQLLESELYANNRQKLPLILGHSISGNAVIADLAKMPHLLVAGTTGSGKSVAINTMILSLLFKHSPKSCKFIMIDPKMLELSVYDNIPHLLAPVVTEPRKAVSALKWVVQEMESRYRAMSTIGVRNIQGYNEMVKRAAKEGRTLTKNVQSGFDPKDGEPIYQTVELDQEPLPFIVVIVDEMADLMLVAGKEIEGSIQRLAQMARAAGIHLIMATQRPSVDVITGVIKANFPTRISFQVTSKIDSRTILGEQGAEQLLGMGDMLFMSGGGKVERVHGPFVSDQEVENIVSYLKKQGRPSYINDVTAMEDEGDASSGQSFDMGDMGGAEDLYTQAVNIVRQSGRPSISFVQRSLKIGYNRAANLVERMEKEGVVSAPNHSGKREVIDANQ